MGGHVFPPVCLFVDRLFLFRNDGLALELFGHPDVQPN